MDDNSNDDETNVESIAAEIAARYPLDDPAACPQVHDLAYRLVGVMLTNRAERHARLTEEDLEIEREESEE